MVVGYSLNFLEGEGSRNLRPLVSLSLQSVESMERERRHSLALFRTPKLVNGASDNGLSLPTLS